MSISRATRGTEAGKQSPRHFESLNKALRNGEIGRGHEKRVYTPNVPRDSGLSWSEMAKIGNSSELVPEAGLRNDQVEHPSRTGRVPHD